MNRMGGQRGKARARAAGGTGSERAARRAGLAGEIAAIVLREGLGHLGLRGLAARLGTSDRMLLYYFGTKDQLVIDVLEHAGARLTVLLAAHGGGPRVSPGQFLAGVVALAGDPDVAPFMRLWTEVIARGARREQPYDQIAARVVQSWIAWIDTRLTSAAGEPEPARAAALLSIVEGITLLEMAAPGCTAHVQCYLSRVLDAADAAAAPHASPGRNPSRRKKQ